MAFDESELFALRFAPRSGGRAALHDDLRLQLGIERFDCDSYYLALDRSLRPDDESDDKIRAVLRRMLRRWIDGVRALGHGAVVFVVYDFSDQGTCWLSFTRTDEDMVVISRGWSTLEGYGVSPSEQKPLRTPPPGFQADGPTVRMEWKDLVAALRRSRDLARETS